MHWRSKSLRGRGELLFLFKRKTSLSVPIGWACFLEFVYNQYWWLIKSECQGNFKNKNSEGRGVKMKSLSEWFEHGMTTTQYISSMKVNRDNLLKVYNSSELEENQRGFLHGLQDKELRALILTADWCGDAMVNIPLFLRIANEALIDVRYFIRDENLELMDQYLTNGKSRSIPIIVLIDQEGKEVAKWGPRAPEAQKLADELFGSLPPKGTPVFDKAFKKAIPAFQKGLTEDKALWESITKDMLAVLK
jgi:hypothetical protein